MKPEANHISKIVLITLVFITVVTGFVSGQSVFVGNAGTQGKVLRKYVEPTELKKLTENPADSIWIVDVRSEKAYTNGHIPTAKSFPAGSVLNRIDEIPKDKYLIIYCTVGGNAKKVLDKLKKNGYKRTMDWGGISRWKWEQETGLTK